MPAHVRTELRPGAFAVVWLEREPVNLMDLALWQQLAAALDQLEGDPVRYQPLASRTTIYVNRMHFEGLSRARTGVALRGGTRFYIPSVLCLS